jgi:hypothetical protein
MQSRLLRPLDTRMFLQGVELVNTGDNETRVL